MSGPGRVRAGMALLVTVLALAMSATAARAQTGPSTSTLRLTDQTTWVGDGGTFTMGLAVSTPDLAGARLQVTVFDALRTRSDFTQTLSDRIDTAALRVFDAVAVAPLGASPAQSIAVNPKGATHAAQSVRLFASGVYPVRVELFDAQRSLLSRLTTHLVYSGADTATITRLDVAWVAPFHAPPPTAAGGAASAPSTDDLAGLANVSRELANHPDVALTVAATPQTVDGLASGTTGGRATVAQLAQAVGAGARQVVAGPYVHLDLPSLLAAGLDSELTAQLATGAGVLAGNLHTAPNGRTWIASGPLSPAAIDELAGRGVERIVTTDDTLSPLPAEDRTRTLAQPFVVVGKSSRLAGAAVDAGLSAQFAAKPDELLAAHQLLAQLAMIQLELPNRRGGRGVVVVPPVGWQPDAAFLSVFLGGLSSAPMLAAVTVDNFFANVTPLQTGVNPVVRSVVAADRQPRGQNISDAAAIRVARRSVASLAAVVPVATPAIADIEHHLLISESADVADRARPAEVQAATRLIDRLKAMVRLPGNQSITFTARQGLIPITILSSAPYPLRVRVRVTSQKLGFRPVGLPGGECTQAEASEICIVDLKAQNTTVRVPVVAKTAGVFSLTVALDSPDGALNLATNQDTVRSTAASGVGVFLSIGAALLLAVWWVRNVIHGRRARRLVPREAGGFGGGEGVSGGPGAWDWAGDEAVGRRRGDSHYRARGGGPGGAGVRGAVRAAPGPAGAVRAAPGPAAAGVREGPAAAARTRGPAAGGSGAGAGLSSAAAGLVWPRRVAGPAGLVSPRRVAGLTGPSNPRTGCWPHSASMSRSRPRRLRQPPAPPRGIAAPRRVASHNPSPSSPSTCPRESPSRPSPIHLATPARRRSPSPGRPPRSRRGPGPRRTRPRPGARSPAIPR